MELLKNKLKLGMKRGNCETIRIYNYEYEDSIQIMWLDDFAMSQLKYFPEIKEPAKEEGITIADELIIKAIRSFAKRGIYSTTDQQKADEILRMALEVKKKEL